MNCIRVLSALSCPHVLHDIVTLMTDDFCFVVLFTGTFLFGLAQTTPGACCKTCMLQFRKYALFIVHSSTNSACTLACRLNSCVDGKNI